MAHVESDSQRDIDRELSAAEAARLASSIEKNPQAKQEFEGLKTVDLALRSLGSVDPPAGLRLDVMRQVRLREALRDSSVRAGKGWIREAWEGLRNTRPVFQVGLGFALGVLVLLPAIWSSSELSFDPRQAAGTISRSYSSAKTLAIEGPGIRGELLRSRTGGDLYVELRLDAVNPVQAEVLLASPVSLDSWESVPASQGSFQFEPGRLLISHTGVASYRFRLNSATDSWPHMSIVISRDGQPIFQEVVP